MLKRTLEFIFRTIAAVLGSAIIVGAVVSVLISLAELVHWMVDRFLLWMFIIPITVTAVISLWKTYHDMFVRKIYFDKT
jgi:hypothetical protein